MERWHAKLISLIGMFIVIFVCMCLPIKVSTLINRKGAKAGRILGLLRCFAGGVFLCTILLHMVPETHDQIQHYLLDPRDMSYPFAELALACGFFFICLFERTVLTIDSKNRKSKNCHMPTNQVMDATHTNQQNGTPCPLNEVMDDAEREGEKNANGTTLQNGCSDHKTVHEMENGSAKQVDSGHESKGNQPDQSEITKTRSVILVLALSFECIFDGLSVSLQLDPKGVWNMFLAILSHEFIIAFCLGVELVKYYSTKKVVLSAFAYAMMPPAGCVIGLVITEANLNVDIETIELVSAFLIAFAAGIFLYCTFIGMLGEELIQDCTFEKILVTMIGSAIMCGMAALPDTAQYLDEPSTTQSPDCM